MCVGWAALGLDVLACHITTDGSCPEACILQRALRLRMVIHRSCLSRSSAREILVPLSRRQGCGRYGSPESVRKRHSPPEMGASVRKRGKRADGWETSWEVQLVCVPLGWVEPQVREGVSDPASAAVRSRRARKSRVLRQRVVGSSKKLLFAVAPGGGPFRRNVVRAW